ncbi:MAG: lysophospholipid acyltransferase family protein [Calditrichia bacterium]
MKKLKEYLILFIAQLFSRPFLKLFRSSLKIKVLNGYWVKRLRKEGNGIIYGLWHENMILPLLIHQDSGVAVLVSQHFDGEIIARILKSFGMASVRGSSTRGGKAAYLRLKKLMTGKGAKEVAFTPDGPTGPRRIPKKGIFRLARETGAPILPIAVAADKYKRLNSWDRFLAILPFSKCVVAYGKPLWVNKDTNDFNEVEKEFIFRLEQAEREALKCLK